MRGEGRSPLRIAILGATGSVGTQALEVIDRYPDRFEVFGLVTGSSDPGRSARHLVRASDPESAERIEAMITDPDCDLVLIAGGGARALRPTLMALDAGKLVALATKEVLVMAGELVMDRVGPGQMRPVDSEHSAIWQCLWGESPASVGRLILTASGGPFRNPEIDLGRVTREQALAHPRWEMGPKITIDCATLMNKGLELIEAHHLFRIPLDRVEVLVHPQSTVHSLVEMVDGSLKAQLGNPDMRLPIGLALAYPERLPGLVPATHLELSGPLEFHQLDEHRFPAVRLARETARRGPPFPSVLNAANEEAVKAFLAGGLRFCEIIGVVEGAVDAYDGAGQTLEAILDADAWARAWVRAKGGNLKG